MNRAEHLQWCKDRALAYLPDDPQNAFASMMSDLTKHDELANHEGIQLGTMSMMISGWITNPITMRSFIEGFN